MPSPPPPPPPPDSSTTTTTTTTTATLPPPSQPPPRKFPAPCWTQDETLALIHCYQDKWFSLRRRNLRTADWEAVADDVNRRCPNQSPPKTSAQCRHKMEKLRKRYRAEKQRISNLPVNYHTPNHRFYPSSSWVFFDLMDSMELGSTPGSTSIVTPTPLSSNPPPHHQPIQQNSSLNFQNGNVNESGVSNNGGKEDLGKYFDEILRSVGKSGIATGAPTTKFKVNHSTRNVNLDKMYFDNEEDDGGDYEDEGFDNNPLFNSKKRKFGFGGGSGGGGERMRGSNGYSTSKRGGGGRGEEVVEEMVASIKMLGEGMVKMEKMKMELMQDLEKQRMELEMNNTRMILESQHNIVSAFLHGFKKKHHHHHHNSKKVVKVVQME